MWPEAAYQKSRCGKETGAFLEVGRYLAGTAAHPPAAGTFRYRRDGRLSACSPCWLREDLTQRPCELSTSLWKARWISLTAVSPKESRFHSRVASRRRRYFAGVGIIAVV